MRVISMLMLAALLMGTAPSAMAERDCPLMTSWDVSVGIEDWKLKTEIPEWNDDPQCWDNP